MIEILFSSEEVNAGTPIQGLCCLGRTGRRPGQLCVFRTTIGTIMTRGSSIIRAVTNLLGAWILHLKEAKGRLLNSRTPDLMSVMTRKDVLLPLKRAA